MINELLNNFLQDKMVKEIEKLDGRHKVFVYFQNKFVRPMRKSEVLMVIGDKYGMNRFGFKRLVDIDLNMGRVFFI